MEETSTTTELFGAQEHEDGLPPNAIPAFVVVKVPLETGEFVTLVTHIADLSDKRSWDKNDLKDFMAECLDTDIGWDGTGTNLELPGVVPCEQIIKIMELYGEKVGNPFVPKEISGRK